MRIDFKKIIINFFFDKKVFPFPKVSSMDDKLIRKYRIFVGSSTEGKEIASKVIIELEKKGMSPLPWFDCFKNSRPPLQELEQISLNVDGAILVGTMDDEAIIRKNKWTQMRDNVLYEYGLFSGIIGRSKCGLLVPDDESFKIPSDFLGVSCYKTYKVINVEKVISSLVDSINQTISTIPYHETIKTRGKRLLQFVSWIRNESFRLAQDWNNETGRELVSKRIIAISGFIQNDIINLNLSKEYQKLEEIVLESSESFPKNLNERGHIDFHYGAKSLIRGYSASSKILHEIFYMMEEERIIDYCRSNNKNCCCRNGEDREYQIWARGWDQYEMWQDYKRYRPWKFYDRGGEPVCINMAWAFGVAEAATLFEDIAKSNNPLVDLKEWSKHFLPKINESITNFERCLHEEIFGKL